MAESAPATLEDYPNVVDEFYWPFLRALGNLVIAFAQAEAALRDMVSEHLGGDELAAVGVLKAQNAKEQVTELVSASGSDMEEFERDELLTTLDKFWADKERRNRLIHDDWYPLFDRDDPGVGLRGITNSKVPKLTWNEPKVETVWLLAEKFADYNIVMSKRSWWMRRTRLGPEG